MLLSVIIAIICISVSLLTLWSISAKGEQTKITIAIDAGHGGIDGGVVGASGVKESDLNLALAKLLQGYFKEDGFRVIMTRNSSDSVYKLKQHFKRNDMAERVRIVNKSKAMLLVSLHINKYSASFRRGIQVFYGKEDSIDLAKQIQKDINEKMNIPTLNRGFSALYGDYYLIKNTICPAIIVECGFISSPEDEKLLLDEEYRMLLAFNLFSSLKAYLSKNEEKTKSTVGNQAFLQPSHYFA